MDEIEQLRKENARLVEELKRLYGVDRPFICGTAGQVGEDGMNEFVQFVLRMVQMVLHCIRNTKIIQPQAIKETL